MIKQQPYIVLLGAESKEHTLNAVREEISKVYDMFINHRSTNKSCAEYRAEMFLTFDKDSITDKLDTLQNKIAILHFAGHSNANGVQSDGEFLYSRHIAGHIDTWQIKPALIVLNGCKNFGQIKLFHEAGVSVVIATHDTVNDKTAANFAYKFYSAMLNTSTNSLEDAFEQSSHNLLMTENRAYQPCNRSMDDDDLEDDVWDWDIYPVNKTQLTWTFNDLITTARPVFDAKNKLYNPYKGLHAFEEEDQSWFYGRDTVTNDILEALLPEKQLNQASRFFSLLGASGSGKSSLVNAGVIPRLRESYNNSLILQTRPGQDAVQNLAQQVSQMLYNRENDEQQRNLRTTEITQQLTEDEQNLSKILQEQLEKPSKQQFYQHIFLIIDQFEELFTHSNDNQSGNQQVKHYLKLLINLVESNVRCTVIIIMRADFLDSALSDAAFGQTINIQPHLMLSPMNEMELRLAIERPAQRQHVTLENSLIESLLNDIEYRVGGLPLLQDVLALLWEKREELNKTLIKLEDYAAFGGMANALKTRADNVYNTFTNDQKKCCQRIFEHLVLPDNDKKDTRTRVDLEEFNSEIEKEVIGNLVRTRLLTTSGSFETDDESSADSKGYIEISHEALIRSWPLLQEWIEASRDVMKVKRLVDRNAKEWKTNGEAKDWLFSGARLAVAKEWLANNPERADANELAFIQASSLSEKEEKEVELRKEREKRELIEAEYLKSNYHLAKAFEEKSMSAIDKGDEIATQDEHHPDAIIQYRHALLYALEAQKLRLADGKVAMKPLSLGLVSRLPYKTIDTEQFIIPSHRSNTIIYSPDGKVIASGSYDSTIQLWNAQSGKKINTLIGHSGSVNTVAYSPNGRTIASGSSGSTIRLWDVQRGQTNKTLKGHLGAVHSITYSPDGKVIATGSDDDTIRLWSVQSGKTIRILKGHSDTVNTIAFSPDGKVIASGSRDNTIRLWNSQSGKNIKTLRGHSGLLSKGYFRKVTSVIYSPDGKFIASSSQDKTIRLWSAESGQTVNVLRGHNSAVNTIAFSPDGKVIVSGSDDNTVRFWSTLSGQTTYVLNEHYHSVTTVAYSPNGKIIASCSLDDTIRLWNAQTDRTINTLEGHNNTATINSIAYSLGGRMIASGSSDGSIQLWNTKSGEIIKRLKEERSWPVSSIAFSPDNKIIAACYSQPVYPSASSYEKYWAIRLWNIESSEPTNTLIENSGVVMAITFSPDGRVIAVGADSVRRTVRSWDVQSEKTLFTLKHSDMVAAVAYRPDGKVIASVSVFDKNIRLWDTQSGQVIKKFKKHSDRITSIAFSPNCKVIVAGTAHGTIQLLNANSGQTMNTLMGHSEPIRSITFSPNGQVLATNQENNIQLWNLDNAVYRLVYEFDANEVSDALKFLWDQKIKDLNFKPTRQKNDKITWTDKNSKYRTLLEMPKRGETKIDQLLLWLEERDDGKEPE